MAGQLWYGMVGHDFHKLWLQVQSEQKIFFLIDFLAHSSYVLFAVYYCHLWKWPNECNVYRHEILSLHECTCTRLNVIRGSLHYKHLIKSNLHNIDDWNATQAIIANRANTKIQLVQRSSYRIQREAHAYTHTEPRARNSCLIRISPNLKARA